MFQFSLLIKVGAHYIKRVSRDITDRIAKAHPWIFASVEVIDNCFFI